MSATTRQGGFVPSAASRVESVNGRSRYEVTVYSRGDVGVRAVAALALHEVTHAVAGTPRHSAAFFDKLFDLAARFGGLAGATKSVVYARERWRPTAVFAAARAGVSEAADDIAERKSRLEELTLAGCRADASDRIDDPSAHRNLWHVDGVPHEVVGDVNGRSYRAYCRERCVACGWEGWVLRQRLSPLTWDPGHRHAEGGRRVAVRQ